MPSPSLTVDSASYSGDMQEKMRDLVREDLPVRKVGQRDASQSRHLADVEDTDYEYSQADITDRNIRVPEDQIDNDE